MDNYFAHAVYGVPLTGDALKKLEEGLKKAGEALSADRAYRLLDEVDQLEKRRDWIDEHLPDLLTQVIEMAGCPSDCTVFHTGHEDERPGESETEPDVWLVGYGMTEFPMTMAEEFTKGKPQWHTWVTAS